MSGARIHQRPTPDGITPLVGYRTWTLSVGPGRWTLRSMNEQIVHDVKIDHPLGRRNDAWLVARCLRGGDHDAPDESCTCGFYAVKSLRTLRRLLFVTMALTRPRMTDSGEMTYRVAGRVHLAGKIVEHDFGYRAERMRIAELLSFPGTEEIVARFAESLGVPAGEPIADPAFAQIVQKGSVLIIDDHALYADAVGAALEAVGMQVIGIAGTASEGLRLADTEPDVILMDVALPDQSGLAAGKRFLERWPRAKVVAVTAVVDRLVAEEALRLGFRGYMTRDTSMTRFVNCIAGVLDGQIVLPHSLGPGHRPTGDDGATLLAALLTPRELEVLAMLVKGASAVDIARRVHVAPNTVRTHVQSMMTKLQVQSRLEAVVFAFRYGLVPLSPPASKRSTEV
jgi:DNA-binding NarL/FixJ family response regulator